MAVRMEAIGMEATRMAAIGYGGNGNGRNWDYGRPYRYGYGYGYYRDTPYVADRPIYENPLPSGQPIKIMNPAANGVTLSYTLNGTQYTIPPGYSQELVKDRDWAIGFSRGGHFGEAQYGLEPGVYSFSASDHGWELYRGAFTQSGPAMAPSNPASPVATAPNPAPKR